MNYRHAFHAGNFADVFKHAILVRILVHLREKPAAFRVIDTHAGDGLYDLADEAASRTGEWRDGIGRLAAASLPEAAAECLAPYLDAVRACNDGTALRFYPGSPLLARHLMRPQDRLVACELEPDAAAALARHLRAAGRAADGLRPRGRDPAKVVAIDGWTALEAYVPPRERRGIVVVDPSYERPDDLGRLADGVAAAWRKWPTGIYFMWYPITERAGPDRLAAALGDIGEALRIEMTVASAPDGLGACGVIVVNPPWRLAADLGAMVPPLVDVLRQDDGGNAAITTLDHGPLRRAGRTT
jgi:23S rRNA (adenine2030-N6)-methyltransferase